MLPGSTLALNGQDDAVNGAHDAAQGGKNMTTLVERPHGRRRGRTVQLGRRPGRRSRSANAAGLLHVQPGEHEHRPDLPAGCAQYRPTNPDKINYVRLAAPDSIQGPAGADYVYNDLGAHSVYILDDTETFGVGVGDSFQAEFVKDGGTVTKRDSAPKSTTDYTPLFTAAAQPSRQLSTSRARPRPAWASRSSRAAPLPASRPSRSWVQTASPISGPGGTRARRSTSPARRRP